MATAKLFQNGRSQAVRLPKEFRFDSDEGEVIIKRLGKAVVLISKSELKNFWVPCRNFRTILKLKGIKHRRRERSACEISP
jgi:antitoxin VapB